MRIKVQVIVDGIETASSVTEEITCIERKEISSETLGLTLEESKTILSELQKTMVSLQINEYVSQHHECPICGIRRPLKDSSEKIIFRTIFGKLEVSNPRYYTCKCQHLKRSTFSPVAGYLTERTSPELLYLQTKWASLMSYGMTVDLLEDILPLKTNVTAILDNTHKIAKRLESELGEEKYAYIEGCPRDWGNLPLPDKRITVGIDGGYLHGREKDNRKAGSFEVIVGKSMQEGEESKRFGFVHGDEKAKRRLYEVLKEQGFQLNQDITFLSDGGDTVRDLQTYLSPQAEHVLDWFHVTMRITVLRQMAKGFSAIKNFQDLDKTLERIKWYLWHGNVFRALQLLEEVESDIEDYQYENESNKPNKKLNKLCKTVSEFKGYISSNRNFIPNYQDRYFYGESISSAFVESTVNEVISKRMKKKQQMRWTKKGAHLLLQVRIKTLNGDLRNTFQRWYPEMKRAS